MLPRLSDPATIYKHVNARMEKSVYSADLKSAGESLAGSSPAPGTN